MRLPHLIGGSLQVFGDFFSRRLRAELADVARYVQFDFVIIVAGIVWPFIFALGVLGIAFVRCVVIAGRFNVCDFVIIGLRLLRGIRGLNCRNFGVIPDDCFISHVEKNSI